MQKDRLFVFDIETIPDVLAARRLLDDNTSDDAKIIEDLTNYHINISNGNSFFRQPFWKVVCISYVEAEITRKAGITSFKVLNVKSAGSVESSEEDIISGFGKYCSKHLPRLVTFNGKNFDIPVLKYRSMYYRIPFEWFYKNHDQSQYKANTYDNKWNEDINVDLLNFFRPPAGGGIKMQEVCALFGVPVKIDADGSGVHDLYQAGEIQKIRDYCETDALATFILYIIVEYHKGNICRDGYTSSIMDLFDKLSKDKRPHIDQFLSLCKDSPLFGEFVPINSNTLL